MAKKRKYSYGRRKTSRRNRRGYSKMSIKEFAYKMGLVERGLKNPDSLITAAHKRGKEKAEKSRKTLF